jgi:hypothetical protein
MKIRHIIFLIFNVLISCNQKQACDKNQKTLKIEKQTPLATLKSSKGYSFDNSLIPSNLLDFVETKFDSLRIPNENDYEIEYFENNNKTGLPYFCSGYFNIDTLRDYAMVLIKDSLNHFVYLFHSNAESFEPFLLEFKSFSSEYGSKRKYAVFDLENGTDRELEGIDTVYSINTDYISISHIYNSRSSLFVWNEKTKSYNRLFFD